MNHLIDDDGSNYNNYKIKHKNLKQKDNGQGLEMTLMCDISHEQDENGHSPSFVINDSIRFRVMYKSVLDIATSINIYYRPVTVRIYIMFYKKTPIEQSSPTYIANFASKKFGIKDVIFCTCCEKWHEVDFYRWSRYSCEFDVDVSIKEVSILSGISMPLHKDEEFADFELRGEDGAIRVHKAILATASPVLRRMLSGTWKETTEGNIEVPGTTKSTLQALKDYIYLNTLPETDLEQMMLLASYYMMTDLEQRCLDRIVNKLTAENATEMLEYAMKNKKTRLMCAIMKAIEKGSIRVKEIEGHELAKQESVKEESVKEELANEELASNEPSQSSPESDSKTP